MVSSASVYDDCFACEFLVQVKIVDVDHFLNKYLSVDRSSYDISNRLLFNLVFAAILRQISVDKL
ncbi:MAG: hypothetical protein ACK56F_21385, partial [bacterium]